MTNQEKIEQLLNEYNWKRVNKNDSIYNIYNDISYKKKEWTICIGQLLIRFYKIKNENTVYKYNCLIKDIKQIKETICKIEENKMDMNYD